MLSYPHDFLKTLFSSLTMQALSPAPDHRREVALGAAAVVLKGVALSFFWIGRVRTFIALAGVFSLGSISWHAFAGAPACNCFGGSSLLNHASPGIAVCMSLLSGVAYWASDATHQT